MPHSSIPRFLSRPYARVDREKFKSKLLRLCKDGGVKFLKTTCLGVDHKGPVTTIKCANGSSFDCSIVVDATGFSRRLVKFDQPFDPGYQVRGTARHGAAVSRSNAPGAQRPCWHSTLPTHRPQADYRAPFPACQGAYGILCEVESHPFEMDKMLFMDWRDDHCKDDPAMLERNSRLPTFLYAMPMGKTRRDWRRRGPCLLLSCLDLVC